MAARYHDEPTSATPAAGEEHAEASLPQPEDRQTDEAIEAFLAGRVRR